MDSGDTSHMVNLERKMTNLKDAKKRVTVVDSRTLTGEKRGNWNGWKRRDRKLHGVKLRNMAIIPGLHKNKSSMTRELQKGFQVTPEGYTLILKKNQLRFVLTIK